MLEARIKRLEDMLKTKNDKSNKRLFINIRDEKYVGMFTDEYLKEHYPGYLSYITLYLPDNGRCAVKDDRPYMIREE